MQSRGDRLTAEQEIELARLMREAYDRTREALRGIPAVEVVLGSKPKC